MTAQGLPDGAREQIAAWIVEEGIGGASLSDLVAGVGERLLAAGVQLSRAYLALPTISAEIRALNVAWRRDLGVHVDRVAHDRFPGAFEASPVAFMLRENIPRKRWHLAEPGGTEGYATLEELKAAGDTDYIAHIVAFAPDDTSALRGVALTACTDRPSGFRRDEIELLTAIVPTLALAAYRIALLGITTEVLGAYIGHDAALRVLGGQMRRGHGHSRRAALMFADLKGFTQAAEIGREGIVERLGHHLVAMAEPVEAQGGEVLKFLGDGLLAAFPADEDATDESACAAALAAACDALRRNAEVNAGLPGANPLHLDIALHRGEVFYGNIGAGTRLDFTVIGPAVNECSRIERLCDELGRHLLMSEDFATCCGCETVPLGRFTLRGVSGERAIYGLAEEPGGVSPGRP